MLRPPRAISRAALASVLVLAGCGGSGAPPEGAKIPFKSAAIVNNLLPARYTCDGQNITPPLEWGAVPTGTHELVLFILGLTPQGPSGSIGVSVEWAAAGLNPQLHSLAAGRLPQGAQLAVAENGKTQHYSVCPPRKSSKQYQFELYALPAGDAVAPNFTGLQLLASLHPAGQSASPIAHGSFPAVYKRK